MDSFILDFIDFLPIKSYRIKAVSTKYTRRGLCYSLIQEYDKSKEDLVTIMTLQEHGTEIGY